MTQPQLSPIEDIIDDARNGRMFILVDDEDRENEGDLVIPAQMATPQAINFMAKYGRGLICLALSQMRVQQLRLPLMSPHNQSRHQTAFTVSIEAKEGITTGISAPDRARTIAVAIDPNKGAEDIATPGHVFPLAAKDGGVLVRTGHTEAAVDVARLAGLNPAGVICEIMKDDGTMARMPDLLPFAAQHGLKIATIADLIAYRLRYDRLVQRVTEGVFSSRFGGEFQLIVYQALPGEVEHVALVKGDITPDEPLLVRMHALQLLQDVLGGHLFSPGDEIERSLRAIEAAGKGILVLLRENNRTPVADMLNSASQPRPKAPADPHLRDYGIGAQILLDLGVRQMTLLTNSKPQVVALEGYGLKICGHQPLSE